MTQIRVHELASELGVSTQQVLSVVEELGQKVRGPSTVIGVSVAAKVRSRCRASRSIESLAPSTVPAVTSAPGTATSAPVAVPVAEPAAAAPQSLFLPPVAPPAVPAYSAGAPTFANPFLLPDAGPALRVQPPRPSAGPAGQRPAVHRALPQPELVADPVDDFDELWRGRGFDQAAQELWCQNGIRPRDAALADQCRSTGIAPDDLPRKLSGRTVLQRLRDGESTTSVWARIQEADQQPRRAGTKLTGRFQLS